MKEHPYFKNFFVTEDGQVISGKSGKILKQYTNEFGYAVVGVKDPVDGKWKRRRVHRLVAETYIPNPEDKREVNHIDCVKGNNHRDNLEWNSSKENKDHAWKNGLYTSFGEDHPDAIYSDDLVHRLCQLMEEGARNKDLSETFGIHKDTISAIRTGKSWGHISSQYKLSKKRTERKSPEFVLRIAEHLANGLRDREVAKILSIDPREVNRIRNRVVHKTLTKDYEF